MRRRITSRSLEHDATAVDMTAMWHTSALEWLSSILVDTVVLHDQFDFEVSDG